MSFKGADRLEYYFSRTKQPPQIFRTLYDQLPLLIQTFEEIKTACEKEKISTEQGKVFTEDRARLCKTDRSARGAIGRMPALTE